MKLIDREEAINNIRYLWDWNTVDGISSTTVLKQTISDIRNTPLVDAVPVVRCKDCTFWSDEDGIREDENTGKRFARCKIHNTMHTGWCPYEDDFCSCGEKRENE